MLGKLSMSFALVVAIGLSPSAWAQEEGETEEEAAAASEPSPDESAETADGTPVIAQPVAKRAWGVGARLRYIFLPAGVTELFVDHATSLSAVGLGAEVTTRKGNFDIVFGFQFDSLTADAGLYQDKGDDPGQCLADPNQCPDYREFDDFGMFGIDASFIWHAKITDRIQLRYGAGIGLAFMTGDMYLTPRACPPGTTLDSLDDPDQCALATGQRVAEEDVPPVLPIINLLVGARFQLADNISFNVETGFRDVFYLGAGFGYFL
jgi:hypothetical protein